MAEVEDTYAEAFRSIYAEVLITARDDEEHDEQPPITLVTPTLRPRRAERRQENAE